jgi:hypothetical protein
MSGALPDGVTAEQFVEDFRTLCGGYVTPARPAFVRDHPFRPIWYSRPPRHVTEVWRGLRRRLARTAPR